MLKIDGICKSFGEKTVFEGFSYTFPTGSRNLIMGKSGAGKTTLLRIISGLEKAECGKVILPDESRIAFMFQEPRLFPWMSVFDNINSVLSESQPEKTAQILGELGLDGEIYAMPSQLSGGMQRRVSLARTLLYPADIYLFDEPFAGLDPAIAKKAADVIMRYTEGKTIIIVSHDRSMLDDSITTVEI